MKNNNNWNEIDASIFVRGIVTSISAASRVGSWVGIPAGCVPTSVASSVAVIGAVGSTIVGLGLIPVAEALGRANDFTSLDGHVLNVFFVAVDGDVLCPLFQSRDGYVIGLVLDFKSVISVTFNVVGIGFLDGSILNSLFGHVLSVPLINWDVLTPSFPLLIAISVATAVAVAGSWVGSTVAGSWVGSWVAGSWVAGDWVAIACVGGVRSCSRVAH